MIPEEFKLNGETYKVNRVKYEEGVECYDEDRINFGNACMHELVINVSEEILGVKQSDNRIENTFYHELVHCIFNELGANELTNDEVLVQAIGNLLQEFNNTKK